MTDQQEQHACEANTDDSWAIPLGSVWKHIVTDPLEDILKQIEIQTPMNHTYTQNKQLCYPQKWSYIWPTMCSHMCEDLFHLIIKF